MSRWQLSTSMIWPISIPDLLRSLAQDKIIVPLQSELLSLALCSDNQSSWRDLQPVQSLVDLCWQLHLPSLQTCHHALGPQLDTTLDKLVWKLRLRMKEFVMTSTIDMANTGHNTQPTLPTTWSIGYSAHQITQTETGINFILLSLTLTSWQMEYLVNNQALIVTDLANTEMNKWRSSVGVLDFCLIYGVCTETMFSTWSPQKPPHWIISQGLRPSSMYTPDSDVVGQKNDIISAWSQCDIRLISADLSWFQFNIRLISSDLSKPKLPIMLLRRIR